MMKSIDLNKPVEIPSWLRIAARPTSIGSGELERRWLEIGEESTDPAAQPRCTLRWKPWDRTGR
jgi:hypothetical protein